MTVPTMSGDLWSQCFGSKDHRFFECDSGTIKPRGRGGDRGEGCCPEGDAGRRMYARIVAKIIDRGGKWFHARGLGHGEGVVDIA